MKSWTAEFSSAIQNNIYFTQYVKHDLEKKEAARIATGTTKLVSIEHLYREIEWDTLQSRRKSVHSSFIKWYGT